MKNTLVILGMSEASLTMIFDILENNKCDLKIIIVNNLNLIPEKTYINNTFEIEVVNEIPKEYDSIIIGIAVNKNRKKIRNLFNYIETKNFTNIINDSSIISSTTKIGNNVIINPLTCIAGQSVIGDFVFINRGVTIGHHTKIGDFVSINPGANIAGNVVIGNNSQIGIGVTIIDGITIGSNVIIGAGSIVTKDIPSNVIAYGNPCKIIRPNE